MANKDKSIDPVLLKSARKQFLAKGFVDASVQEIADYLRLGKQHEVSVMELGTNQKCRGDDRSAVYPL